MCNITRKTSSPIPVPTKTAKPCIENNDYFHRDRYTSQKRHLDYDKQSIQSRSSKIINHNDTQQSCIARGEYSQEIHNTFDQLLAQIKPEQSHGKNLDDITKMLDNYLDPENNSEYTSQYSIDTSQKYEAITTYFKQFLATTVMYLEYDDFKGKEITVLMLKLYNYSIDIANDVLKIIGEKSYIQKDIDDKSVIKLYLYQIPANIVTILSITMTLHSTGNLDNVDKITHRIKPIVDNEEKEICKKFSQYCSSLEELYKDINELKLNTSVSFKQEKMQHIQNSNL
jgi:hypothetical protein